MEESEKETKCVFCGESETIVVMMGEIVLNVCYACSVTVDES